MVCRVSLTRDQYQGLSYSNKVPPPDKLGKELGISVNLCRKGKIPVSEFCNKDLSDIVNEEKEFEYFTKIRDAQEITRFSFLRYEFILTTATKVQALSFDSEVRMGNEQRSTYVRRVVFPDEETNPYCHFTVRRDHLVDDALKIVSKDSLLSIYERPYSNAFTYNLVSQKF
ncbi:hypothetical protein QYM36_002200 [Artemia franciscana]|uniref:Uncharacterized protein n=1 Tax=Artemia franciscana TaxID=6661 RepID=A0AA88I4C1_ARTSF|nr:hypothetical protein QYM36_002200 [Artemia franciscana]